jgi:hypothetical protein
MLGGLEQSTGPFLAYRAPQVVKPYLHLVPPPSPARLPIDAQAALRLLPVGRERGAPALPPAINSPHPITAPPSSIGSSVVGCYRQAGRMFSLSQIEHDLPMPPHLLSRPLPDAIKAELERLFLDKVTGLRNLLFCRSQFWLSIIVPSRGP